MIMQLGGRLDEAMDWYNICLSHSENPHQDPEGYEAKTLALISTGFIFSGERYYNQQRVSYYAVVPICDKEVVV